MNTHLAKGGQLCRKPWWHRKRWTDKDVDVDVDGEAVTEWIGVSGANIAEVTPGFCPTTAEYSSLSKFLKPAKAMGLVGHVHSLQIQGWSVWK